MKKIAGLAVARIESIYKGEPQPGLHTGYRAIDSILRGMDAGDLIILAGRPSMGKSSLGWGIAQNNAVRFAREAQQEGEPGRVAVFFSQEMRDEHLALISIGQEAWVPPHRAESNELNASDMDKIIEAARRIEDLPIEVDDRPNVTPPMIRTALRRLRRRRQIGLLVVDHLQLMRLAKPRRDDNRVLELGQLTADLKAIGKDFACPVLLLSQLSRAVEQRENKRPQLADLRESGAIEQDADAVLFIYRDEYYLARQLEGDSGNADLQARLGAVRGLAEVNVAKQRRGRIGTAMMGFRAEFQQFHDV